MVTFKISLPSQRTLYRDILVVLKLVYVVVKSLSCFVQA